MIQLDVLYEDNHLLVVNKPAGLATMGALPGEDTLAEVAKRYLKRKYDKPGNVYVGVVSRLDNPVSGAIVLARTSKAASRLSEQFREHQVEKRYWALSSSKDAAAGLPDAGQLLNWLRKDESRRCMCVCGPRAAGAVRAELTYRVLLRLPQRLWLELNLITGRKHQIRVQLSDAGCPIDGDSRYGSRVAFPHGIALHSRWLQFEHPVRHELLTFTAPLPESWPALPPQLARC
ncbi:MAG: RluA family pseudouridine synthase [Planctomycetales bacterium]|nr:RluA family pseudouridine synthase [Planctomycetales bacterium]